MKINDILDIDKTIASSLFNNVDYAWEVLPKIKDNIIAIGKSLDKDKYRIIQN